MKDRAIILVAFGTSTAAKDTYAFFEEKLRERFPGEDIFWAFSSRTLRKSMAKEGIPWKGLKQVLKTIQVQGRRQVVLQPLYIVPGIEFEKVNSAAELLHLNISVGMPLLSTEIDCYRTIDALSSRIPDMDECITVLAGHGTIHSGAGAMYMQFEECLKARYPRNVHVSVVEGVPSWESVRDEIEKSTLRKVKFIPLMFVAGEHIMQDVMGNHNESWKSQLEGFEIDGGETGLGFNEKIQEIYFDHLGEAMERLDKSA